MDTLDTIDQCMRIQIGDVEDNEGNELVVSIHGDEPDELYTLVFSQYVSYLVENESFCGPKWKGDFTGRHVGISSNSDFIDFVKSTSTASDSYPGPLTHYIVNGLNLMINVVTTNAPSISKQPVA